MSRLRSLPLPPAPFTNEPLFTQAHQGERHEGTAVTAEFMLERFCLSRFVVLQIYSFDGLDEAAQAAVDAAHGKA